MNKETTKYSLEEKMAIVRLVESGRSQRSVAAEYGVSEPTLREWRRRYGTKRTHPEEGTDDLETEQPDKEVERLRAQIRELENEVAFLKKVSAYFVKSPK